MKSKPWELSDVLWQKVAPLIPARPVRNRKRKYKRRAGGGRKCADYRPTLAGILYVLSTGCQWQAVPRIYGSPSTIHRRFQEWRDAGFFRTLWKEGLSEYDELKGIDWEWQSIDGAMIKAPLGGEATGRNPTDRGKKRKQASRSG
jgi:transposase